MDFAKQQLAKYGWTEGKGLGRHETGITKALKPQLKFDRSGMGHDAAETFTNHWWEKAFNAAADNITVTKAMDGSVNVEAEDGFEIDTHKVSSKKRKHMVYNNFVKTATLTNEGAMADESCEAEEDAVIVVVPVLTDEELFRACGGRTAHKGARHGLGLNGKLARIEKQERLLLNLGEKPEEEAPPRKKKKAKKTINGGDTNALVNVESVENTIEINDQVQIISISSKTIKEENKKSNKKSKKSKAAQGTEEITLSEEILNNCKSSEDFDDKEKLMLENCSTSNIVEKQRKKSKSKKSKSDRKTSKEKDLLIEEIVEKDLTVLEKKKAHKMKDVEVVINKAQKEPNRKKSEAGVFDEPAELQAETENPLKAKKEKHKKKKHATCLSVGDIETQDTQDAVSLKKKKKSCKKENAEKNI